jgi:hypothetical protein
MLDGAARSRSSERDSRDSRDSRSHERHRHRRTSGSSWDREQRAASPQRDRSSQGSRSDRNSPDYQRREKRARSHSRESRGRSLSPSSPSSPSKKKAKKEKRKKEKRKKKDKRKREKRKKSSRAHSPHSSGSSDSDNGSAAATASPSKHRSRVIVVESPRVEASRPLPSDSAAPAPQPRAHGHAAKLQAAAEQARRREGAQAGRMMSEAERQKIQRATTQTHQRSREGDSAAASREHPIDTAAKPTTEQLKSEQPKTFLGITGPSAAAGPFGTMKPRSVRKSGAGKKTDTSKSRMSDRPEFPLKVQKRDAADAPSTTGPRAAPAASAVPAAQRPATTAAPMAQHTSVHADQVAAQPGASKTRVTCCECEDQPADVHCIDCNEPFCRPCWGGQHRRGKRSLHKLQPILGEVLERTEQPTEPSLQPEATVPGESAEQTRTDDNKPIVGAATQELGTTGSIGPALPPGGMAALYSNDSERRLKANRERMKWLPLRLTAEERTLLSLLQGALHRSDYTDKVDVFSHSEKVKRQLAGIHECMTTQCGLQLANSFKAGQRLVRSNVRANHDFFARAFEIGRRYKVMNPQKMRSDYGKMMYLLMDSQRQEVQHTLQVDLVRPIQTVGQLLKAKHGEGILASEDLEDATRDLSDVMCDRSQLIVLQQQKREAAARIVDKYSTKDLSKDDIMRVLESISDANNFLANNEKPVTRMLELLKTNFDRKGPKGNVKGNFSLEIGRGNNFRSGGSSGYGGGYGGGYGKKKYTMHSMGGSNSGGAKLSHSHATQFTFTSQTFMLWQQVSKNMYSESMMIDGHDCAPRKMSPQCACIFL